MLSFLCAVLGQALLMSLPSLALLVFLRGRPTAQVAVPVVGVR